MNQSLTFDLQQTLRSVESAGLFVSLCTISRRPNPPTADAGGWPLYAYTPVTGLVNIPCMLAVQSPYRPNQGGVLRTPADFDTLAEFHLLLDGYFPGILQNDTATVDGVVYEINAVEPDSQKVLTRLAVRRYAK